MTTNQQETAAVSHINDLSLASEFLMCAIRALAAGDATDDESVSGPLTWALCKIKTVADMSLVESN